MSDQNLNPIIEHEISLKDIINFIVENWKLIIMSSLVAGALGAGYALRAPSKYQATANIQVAKVAGIDVEGPALLLEKLKMPTYFSQGTFTACQVIDSTDPGTTLVKQLKPSLSKTAPIITVTFREVSAEIAKNCLELLLNDIRKHQNILAKPIIQTKNIQLNMLKQKLESAEKISKILSTKNHSFDFSDSKFSASTLLLATALSNENVVKELRSQINDLEIALAEPQTKEAFLTSPIHAPSTRVENNIRLILLLSLMAGAILAIGYLLLRKAFK